MDALLVPVQPFRGLRTIDAWGVGGFGAPRSRGPKRYTHSGVDFVTVADPPDEIVAVRAGLVTRVGFAYEDDLRTLDVDESDLRTITLLSEPFLIKYLYVDPLVPIGTPVGAGEILGRAQDRAAFAKALDPNRGPMTNHIHLKVSRRTADGMTWQVVDPLRYMTLPVQV